MLLLEIPPAPMVSALPLMLNTWAVLSYASEAMLHAVFTLGAGRTVPAKMTLAVPLFASAPSGFQFRLSPQLLVTPLPPSHVCALARCAHAGQITVAAAKIIRFRRPLFFTFRVI